MKALADLAPEIEAGRVVFPVDSWLIRAFKTDQGVYMLSCRACYFSAATFAELLTEASASAKDTNRPENIDLELALMSHHWQVLDTSLPDYVPPGKTLLELRSEIEAGLTVYPTYLAPNECEFYIKRDERDGIIWTSSRAADNAYQSVDELVCRIIDAFSPGWLTEKTPAYLAEVERQRAEERAREQEYEREQAALDALPPVVVEMSAREHQQYQAWLDSKNAPGDEFDPFIDIDEKPRTEIPPAFHKAFSETQAPDF